MLRRFDWIIGVLVVVAIVGVVRAEPAAAQKKRRGVSASERSLRPSEDTLALSPAAQAALLKIVGPYRPRTRYEKFWNNGGKISLVVVRTDSVQLRAIQEYLHDMMTAFRRDDFDRYFKRSTGEVPGRAVLHARRSLLVYEFRPLPWGGELYMLTGDSITRVAIHKFIDFQRAINTPN